MKTTKDFYNDTWGAMQVMKEYWRNKGYKVAVFTNINGDDVCSVTVDDGGDDEYYEQEFIAVFERI